jgi:hypothetical protein
VLQLFAAKLTSTAVAIDGSLLALIEHDQSGSSNLTILACAD